MNSLIALINAVCFVIAASFAIGLAQSLKLLAHAIYG